MFCLLNIEIVVCVLIFAQTPLMLAAIHGKYSCVERLIQAGANVRHLFSLIFSFPAYFERVHFILFRFVLYNLIVDFGGDICRYYYLIHYMGEPACIMQLTMVTRIASG